MHLTVKDLVAAWPRSALATQAAAQVTFYEGEGFRGRAFTVDRQHGILSRTGFNDRARSAVVEHGVAGKSAKMPRFEGGARCCGREL